MAESLTTMRESDNRSISVEQLDQLRKEQANYTEGSFEWADYQAKIDRIVADNYLRYVNR
jgi:hypothetical protein